MKKGFYSYFGFAWLFLGILYLLMIWISDATIHHLRFWFYVIATCFFFGLSLHHYIKYKKL